MGPARPARSAGRLRTGPLLRYLDDGRATVWVETDAPGEVAVLGHRARTFAVHGHHYAIVVVRGLPPGTATPYDVSVDGERAWPPPDDPFPAPVIRTTGGAGSLRLAFGSCRALSGYDAAGLDSHGADALVALAHRLAEGRAERPDLLLMLGDQIYADAPSEALRDLLRQRTAVHPDVREEVCSFEEYTWLYDAAWTDPALRWLLSTVPSAMVLDDHDLRDDWNSSRRWRERATRAPWWRDRVVGGLGSYWVYQHLGNLSPEELAEEPTLRAVRDAGDPDAADAVVDAMAWLADAEPAAVRWSFSRDVGGVRLVVVDSRCGRSLAPGRRGIVDDAEWRWLAGRLTGGPEHLVVGTSLPWLLPPTIHELEGWNEAVSDGAWGPGMAWLSEHVRLDVDLEHWAAFRRSFDALAAALVAVARGERGAPPASVLVLSGDVHSSYVTRARFADDAGAAPIWQLVMSPFRNPLSISIRGANRVLSTPVVRRAVTWLARRAGVEPPAVQWELADGHWFDNGVMTLVVDGRDAAVEVDAATLAPGGRQVLRRTARIPLAPPDGSTGLATT